MIIYIVLRTSIPRLFEITIPTAGKTIRSAWQRSSYHIVTAHTSIRIVLHIDASHPPSSTVGRTTTRCQWSVCPISKQNRTDSLQPKLMHKEPNYQERRIYEVYLYIYKIQWYHSRLQCLILAIAYTDIYSIFYLILFDWHWMPASQPARQT